MKKPFLSVVIPTYNRALLLERCLESFSKQTFQRENFEVLTIDDGSQDATRLLLGSNQFDFNLRPFFQNHGGAAKARNRGIDEAKGDILVFTDDDCIPTPEFLEEHWKAHDQGDNRLVRGPILIVRTVQEIAQKNPSPLSVSMNFFCTSNASLSKEKIIDAGKFDESFGRWEDAELGFRLRKQGLKMHFVMSAIVHHIKPVWRLDDLVRTALSDGQSARKLYNRHPSIRTWMSSGLHPISRLSGKALKPFVNRKLATMKSNDLVDGLWERLIFHRFFIEGLEMR